MQARPGRAVSADPGCEHAPLQFITQIHCTAACHTTGFRRVLWVYSCYRYNHICAHAQPHTHLTMPPSALPNTWLRFSGGGLGFFFFFLWVGRRDQKVFAFPAALGGDALSQHNAPSPERPCLDNTLVESWPHLQPSLGNQTRIWISTSSPGSSAIGGFRLQGSQTTSLYQSPNEGK